MHGAATSSGTSHSQVFTSLDCDREALPRHPLLDLVGDVAAEQVERAVGHVDDAHQAEDEGEAARDDEERGGEGDRVEHDLAGRTPGSWTAEPNVVVRQPPLPISGGVFVMKRM